MERCRPCLLVSLLVWLIPVTQVLAGSEDEVAQLPAELNPESTVSEPASSPDSPELYLLPNLETQPAPADDVAPIEDSGGYVDLGLGYLREQHESVSSLVNVLARKIDNYFAGEKAFAEENESYVRLRLQEQWVEGGRWEANNDVKFRLDLPATKDKYRIVLTYRGDETESLESQTLPSAAAQTERGDQSLFAGIVRSAKDVTKRWESKAAMGIKVHIPPDPFMRFDTRRTFEVGDEWEMTMRAGGSWFYHSGFSAQNSYAFDHALDDSRLFRATSKFQWLEKEDTLEFAQVLDVFHTLDERRLLDYRMGALGNSWSHSRFNKYYLSVIYRQDLYQKSLYLNLIPELAYPREERYRAVMSLTFGIELFFNKF